MDNITFIFGYILPYNCISSFKMARDLLIFGHTKGRLFIRSGRKYLCLKGLCIYLSTTTDYLD